MRKVSFAISLAAGLLLMAFSAKAQTAGQFIINNSSTSTAVTLPNAPLGSPYTQNFTYTYQGNCQASTTLSGLPPGMNFSPGAAGSGQDSAGLSGTPAVEGAYSLGLGLTDNCGDSAAQSYSLNVVSAFNNDSPSLLPGQVGESYSSTINFSYTGPTATSTPIVTITGLPPGITSSTSTFVNSTFEDINVPLNTVTLQSIDTVYTQNFTMTLSGIPTQAGSYNVVLTLSDPTISQTTNYTVNVSNGATPLATPTPTPAGQIIAGVDPDGTNINSGGTIYLITGGQRRPYTSAGAFLSYGFNTWATVVTASQADLSLPVGSFIPPRDGKIICSNKGSDKGTCYLITQGQKAGFTSSAVFTGLGFSFSNTLSGDVSFLNAAPNIGNANEAHLPGVLINKNNTIYLVGNGGLLGVPDMTTLAAWGYSLTDSVAANSADNSYAQIGIMGSHTPGALSPF